MPSSDCALTWHDMHVCLGRDDIWTIKYLPKFKWHHLAESIAYQNRVAEEKMRNEVSVVHVPSPQVLIIAVLFD